MGKGTSVRVCVCIHGLSFSERWMLGSDVGLYAGSRFESHRTGGAFVEHITVSLLDVRLHRVKPSKHHQATGTSADNERKRETLSYK